jgi:hypothetical protein
MVFIDKQFENIKVLSKAEVKFIKDIKDDNSSIKA